MLVAWVGTQGVAVALLKSCCLGRSLQRQRQVDGFRVLVTDNCRLSVTVAESKSLRVMEVLLSLSGSPLSQERD
jgi:hypothetical protein